METCKAAASLDEAIEAHALAVMKNEANKAESFVAARAMQTHRNALQKAKRPFTDFEVQGRAKIGFEYLSKVRWATAGGKLILQSRWSQADERGRWRIVEVEDLSEKRSPWSDIPNFLNGVRVKEASDA